VASVAVVGIADRYSPRLPLLAGALDTIDSVDVAFTIRLNRRP